MTVTPVNETPEWQALEAHYAQIRDVHLRDLFDRLGLRAELAPKLCLIGATGGEPVVVCAAVADGRAEIGIQQIAEIVAVAGVDLVGPIPREVQHTTSFAAGRRLRVTPAATMLVSHRIAAPPRNAARPAATALGVYATSAVRSV